MNELFLLFYGLLAGASMVRLFSKQVETRKRQKSEKLPEKCPLCGGQIKNIPAGTSKKTGQPYREFWVCENAECSFTCNLRNGSYIWNWEKTKKPKDKGNKKEEVPGPDEIRVKDIPF